MAKFNAATAVEAVEYDLRPYVDTFGVVPEPSTDQVETFFDRIADMRKLLMKVERDIKRASASDDDADLEQVLNDLPEEEIDRIKAEMSTYVSDLTSGQPNAAQVDGLPYRVFTAFLTYLMEEYGPKEGSNDSKPRSPSQ